MNTIRTSLAMGALAMAMGFASQTRADILITATDGVHTGTANDHGTPGLATFSGTIGNFTVSIDIGTGFPAVGSPADPVLDLTSLDLTTATTGGTLTISLTETDFTAAAAAEEFISSIVGIYAGSSATMNTYLDTTNTHFGTGTPLSTGLLDNQRDAASAAVGADPFSLTEVVTVTAGSYSLTSIDAAITVPEPTSLSVLVAALLALTIFGSRLNNDSGSVRGIRVSVNTPISERPAQHAPRRSC